MKTLLQLIGALALSISAQADIFTAVTAYNTLGLESDYSNELSFPTAEDAQGKQVAWNANTELDLAGYKIHFGNATRDYNKTINLGNVISWTIDLRPATPGNFRVTVSVQKEVDGEWMRVAEFLLPEAPVGDLNTLETRGDMDLAINEPVRR